MSASRPVAFGLWGLGGHARSKLVPAFGSCEIGRLSAVTTRDAAVLERVAGRTGAAPHKDPKELLADEQLEAVIVALPTGLHHEAGMAVLGAGKHLLSEKPLAAHAEERSELIKEATRRGLVLYDGCMFVHHPQFAALRQAGSELGAKRSVSARFGFPHLDPSDFRYDPSLGGGALRDAGFYPLALAVALLGAGVDILGASSSRDQGYDVDTRGTALAKGSDGVVAHLQWGFGQSYRNEVEIWSECGVVRAERFFSKPPDLETSIEIRQQSGETETRRIGPADHFTVMIDAFAGKVTSGESGPMGEVVARSRLMAEVEVVAAQSDQR